MRAALLVPVVVFGLTAACGGSDRPSPAGSSGGGVTTDAGGAGSADASGSPDDGGGVQPRPALCQGLALGGKLVEELSQPGPAAVPLGGTVVLGTYAAEELDVFGDFDGGTPDGGEGAPGPQATGRTVDSTLIVTKDTLQIVEAYGTIGGATLGPTATRAYAYVAKDSALNAAQQCPASAPTAPIGYTAVGDALALFPDANHRQVYRLKP